jgi:hypothetical protein
MTRFLNAPSLSNQDCPLGWGVIHESSKLFLILLMSAAFQISTALAATPSLDRDEVQFLKELDDLRSFVEKEDFSTSNIDKTFGTGFEKSKALKFRDPTGQLYLISRSIKTLSPQPRFFERCAPFKVTEQRWGRYSGNEVGLKIQRPLGPPLYSGSSRIISYRSRLEKSQFLVLPVRPLSVRAVFPLGNENFEAINELQMMYEQRSIKRRTPKFNSFTTRTGVDSWLVDKPGWFNQPSVMGQTQLAEVIRSEINGRFDAGRNNGSKSIADRSLNLQKAVEWDARNRFLELSYYGKKGIWRVFDTNFLPSVGLLEGPECIERVVAFHPFDENNSSQDGTLSVEKVLSVVVNTKISALVRGDDQGTGITKQNILRVRPFEPLSAGEGTFSFATLNDQNPKGLFSPVSSAVVVFRLPEYSLLQNKRIEMIFDQNNQLVDPRKSVEGRLAINRWGGNDRWNPYAIAIINFKDYPGNSSRCFSPLQTQTLFKDLPNISKRVNTTILQQRIYESTPTDWVNDFEVQAIYKMLPHAKPPLKTGTNGQEIASFIRFSFNRGCLARLDMHLINGDF